MEQIHKLKKKIESTGQLHSVVHTMKALSSVNIRLYSDAAQASEEYLKIACHGLAVLDRNTDKPLLEKEWLKKPVNRGDARHGAIIVGSEQGLVGQFNNRLVQYLKENYHSDSPLVCLGYKMGSILKQEGFQVYRQLPIEEAAHEVTELLTGILDVIEVWQKEAGISSIDVYFNQRSGHASYRPSHIRLLPLRQSDFKDKSKEYYQHGRSPLPMFFGDLKDNLQALLREMIFITLYRAVMVSLASENASRLVAMQNAEKNIEERKDELMDSYNRRRQEAITSELMDILGGFESMSGG